MPKSYLRPIKLESEEVRCRHPYFLKLLSNTNVQPILRDTVSKLYNLVILFYYSNFQAHTKTYSTSHGTQHTTSTAFNIFAKASSTITPTLFLFIFCWNVLKQMSDKQSFLFSIFQYANIVTYD